MTFPPTQEQAAIVREFRTGADVKVIAGAGAGKTSTLLFLAQAGRNRRGLYVTYSKALAAEASEKFKAIGVNVQCKTAHALAFRTHGRRFKHRLDAPRMSGYETARRLDLIQSHRIGPDRILTNVQIAKIVTDTVTAFGQTDDPEPTAAHIPPVRSLADAAAPEFHRIVIGAAKRMWADLADPDGVLRYTHDTYLSQWARSAPRLDYDYVMLDEAQDASPEIARVVMAQRAQKVLVGDPQQSIYAWRGALDAMATMNTGSTGTLSQSFRFGPAVAAEANRWLALLDADLRITGTPTIPSVLAPITGAPARGSNAALFRSNAGAVRHIVDAQAAGIPVAIVGGGTDVKRLAEAAQELQESGSCNHPELVGFGSWEQVQDYVETAPGGQDLKAMVKVIDSNSPAAIIDAINRCVTEDRANLVVCTAHKSKGREWDNVLIGDDFEGPEEGEQPDRAELMLAYVAVTRAKRRLDVGSLAWINDFAPPAPRTAPAPLEHAAPPAADPWATAPAAAPSPRPVPPADPWATPPPDPVLFAPSTRVSVDLGPDHDVIKAAAEGQGIDIEEFVRRAALSHVMATFGQRVRS